MITFTCFAKYLTLNLINGKLWEFERKGDGVHLKMLKANDSCVWCFYHAQEFSFLKCLSAGLKH